MEAIQTQFSATLKDHEELEKYIKARAKAILEETKIDAYESTEIKDLAAALAKAQGEFPRIGFNKNNPYYKNEYADLDTIIHSTRPSLSKYGLSISQFIVSPSEGTTTLITRLRHSSGQWCESRTRITPLKNDPQSFASNLTYMKRYALMSLLCVTGSDDPSDDDGERSMEEKRQEEIKGTSINYNYSNRDEKAVTYPTITATQRGELEGLLQRIQVDDPKIYDKLKEQCKIETLADLPEVMHEEVKRKLMITLEQRKTGKKPEIYPRP